MAAINGLHWEKLGPNELRMLMVLSYYAAIEFAASLRIALDEHPNNLAFKTMAAGELGTDNLRFADYSKRGDHCDFLSHFLQAHQVMQRAPEDVRRAGRDYTNTVGQMTARERVMSVISRERELSHIFKRILTAKGWKTCPELQAFEYYLRRHIELDSGDGGHADLLAKFTVNDKVEEFYRVRLGMYRVIPVLFN